MNKLLNYKTKTKNATPPIFTEIVALFFFTNCQRWEYNIKKEKIQIYLMKYVHIKKLKFNNKHALIHFAV